MRDVRDVRERLVAQVVRLPVKAVRLPVKAARLLRQQVQSARVLDGARYLAMKFGGHASCTTWKDFSAFSGKLCQNLWVVVVHFFQWDVEAATRHAAVRSTEIGHSLSCLWLH